MAATPKQHKALVLEERGKFAVKNNSAPNPDTLPPGAVIVKVLSGIISQTSRKLWSMPGLTIPDPPYVTGQACIGRIVATGPDAVDLAKDDLVYVDTVLRVREDPEGRGVYLWGYFEVASEGKSLGNGVWKDGTNAEYVAAPLENCYKLNEKLLLGTLGYTPNDLAIVSRMLVPFGGLAAIGLQPGETIAIVPATGSFGGAAIHVALALGAHVIAGARTKTALDRVMASHGHTGRVSIAVVSGEDAEADARALVAAAPHNGRIDAFLDFVPMGTQNPTYLKSAVLALRPKGRISVMGGSTTDVAIPYMPLFRKGLTIQGQMMYERDAPTKLFRLVESGHLKLGEKAGIKTLGFKLEDFDKAFSAAESPITGEQHAAVFNP